jgi:NAD(P)-dependent dehydrogenase (short-subunit alcohol dehydrogenase family)
LHARATQRFDLKGHIIWVPGGAGLLGNAVSMALAEHGATVIISDVRDDNAMKLVETIRSDDLSADALPVDASSEESIVECRRKIIEKHGRLDAMVNMTFRYKNTAWTEKTAEEWEYGMRVSSTGAFLLSREAALAMLPNRKGSIVHFSSMYGVVAPDPGMYIPSIFCLTPSTMALPKPACWRWCDTRRLHWQNKVFVLMRSFLDRSRILGVSRLTRRS